MRSAILFIVCYMSFRSVFVPMDGARSGHAPTYRQQQQLERSNTIYFLLCFVHISMKTRYFVVFFLSLPVRSGSEETERRR